MLRLLIVSEVPILRHALAALVLANADVYVMISDCAPAGLTDMLTGMHPDVILVDLITARDVAMLRSQLADAGAYPQSLLITPDAEMRSGIESDEVVSAAASGVDLWRAIRARAGRLETAMHSHEHEAFAAIRETPFTSREREVLLLMKAGRNNAQIARALNVSISTVKFHVSSILDKLKVENRTQAVATAMAHNAV